MKTGNPHNPSQQSQMQQSDAERGRRDASVSDAANPRERQQAGRPDQQHADEEE